MFYRRLLVLGTLLAGSKAQTSPAIPSSTGSFNSSSSSSSTTATSITAPVCCFIAQETASAIYWPITTWETTVREVNLTSITTLITPYENGTEVTNVYTQITATNATFSAAFDGGVNPLRFYDNKDQSFPEQAGSKLTVNATAVVTAGITVQSPAAFFVYSTVKIITAQPVTDESGNLKCVTASSWDEPGYYPEIRATFRNVNSNVENFFRRTVVNGSDSEPSTTIVGEGGFGVVTEITLATPFIYQPARGKTGATEFTGCYQSDESEFYGYVPETLVSYIATQPAEVLTSCVLAPAGPTVVRGSEACNIPASSLPVHEIGGTDIVRETQIRLPRQGGKSPSADPVALPIIGNPTPSPNPPVVQPPTVQQPPVNQEPPAPVVPPSNGGDTPEVVPVTEVPAPQPIQTPVSPPVDSDIGDAINSMIGGSPAPSPGAQNDNGSDQTETIGQSIVPVSDPSPGLDGQTTVIGGSSFIVVPDITTVPAAGLPDGVGSTTLINGTPFVVIQPTNIDIPTEPNTPIGTAVPSALQASKASRHVSWVGFGMALLRGFLSRFY